MRGGWWWRIWGGGGCLSLLRRPFFLFGFFFEGGRREGDCDCAVLVFYVGWDGRRERWRSLLMYEKERERGRGWTVVSVIKLS